MMIPHFEPIIHQQPATWRSADSQITQTNSPVIELAEEGGGQKSVVQFGELLRGPSPILHTFLMTCRPRRSKSCGGSGAGVFLHSRVRWTSGWGTRARKNKQSSWVSFLELENFSKEK